ncbi:BLUF domain-containing protein [Novosphingobium sp. SG720]|uniref:BLUF domain-containing protein n=1 Tax=Novosphingobium TaxID=165696 RepID=UPI001446AAF4|nr:BLUF domain-containing protein [Novosphingobium sp. SG720]NKJ42031.1 hypothetical protein [Novosphingobium sp. SG720]
MRPEATVPLGHWLYVSRCMVAPAWAANTVDALVAQAVARNAQLALTGALLFTGSHFVQALEGPEPALAMMRATICRDPRHAGIRTLDEGTLAQRRFADWSLAYAGGSAYLAAQVQQAINLADRVPTLVRLLQAFAFPAPRPA